MTVMVIDGNQKTNVTRLFPHWIPFGLTAIATPVRLAFIVSECGIATEPKAVEESCSLSITCG